MQFVRSRAGLVAALIIALMFAAIASMVQVTRSQAAAKVVPARAQPAVSTRQWTPGASITVSGLGCERQDRHSPRGVKLMLTRAALTYTSTTVPGARISDGRWTARLTLPRTLARARYTLASTCRGYESDVAYPPIAELVSDGSLLAISGRHSLTRGESAQLRVHDVDAATGHALANQHVDVSARTGSTAYAVTTVTTDARGWAAFTSTPRHVTAYVVRTAASPARRAGEATLTVRVHS